jgi:plasmid replication initiation protein
MRQISECLEFDETASSQARKDSRAAPYNKTSVERRENVSRRASSMSLQPAVTADHEG